MDRLLTKDELTNLSSTDGIIELLCGIPNFKTDDYDELDYEIRDLIDYTMSIKLLSDSQINGNLRRSMDAGNLALINQRKLTALSLLYFGIKDENGKYVKYICPYTGKEYNLEEIRKELNKPYNYRDLDKVLELEHIMPHSSGGGTVLFNCIPASREANSVSEKGNLHLLDWLTNPESSGYKFYENGGVERLIKLVNYMLSAYEISFEEYEESELEFNYDSAEKIEEGIDNEENLESNDRKVTNNKKKIRETSIDGDIPFLNQLIDQLEKEGYDTKDIRNKLVELEKNGIINNLEKYITVQKTIEELFKKEDPKSYLTYSLNVDYIKLVNSIETDEPEKIKEIVADRFEEIKPLIVNNAIENFVNMLIILKNAGIDVREIPNSNKQLEDYLKVENEKRKKRGEQEVDVKQILEEVKEKEIINQNIGGMQNYYKSNYKQKYKKALEDAVDKDGTKMFTDDEIDNLTKNVITQDATQDLIDMLIILKNNGIDVRGIPNNNKQLEDYLKDENKKRKKRGEQEVDVEQILEEVKEKGILNLNIGGIQGRQKSYNTDKYKKALKDAVDEDGKKVFTDGEIEKLTRKQNATQDFVNMLIILKNNGIDVREIPNDNKQLEDYLKEVNNVRSERGEQKVNIDQILKELHEKGIIYLNIGRMQNRQKSYNIDKYKKTLIDAVDKEGKKIFTDDEIEKLIECEKSQDATQDLIDMLIILKNNGIDVREIPQSNRSKYTQLKKYLEEVNNSRRKNGEQEVDIGQILKEIEEKGIINLNIGQMQQYQKNRNIDKYKKALKDSVNKEGKNIFTDDEIESLTGNVISRNQTQDLIDMLIILKNNGIDVKGIPNSNMLVTDYLEEVNNSRRKNGEQEVDIGQILKEIEEKGIINLNIGIMQNSQKNNNIDKYKKALKDAIDKEGKKIFTDGETEKLTQKQDATQNLVDMLIILKNNGIELCGIPQNDKMLEDYLKEVNNIKSGRGEQEVNVKQILNEVEIKGITNLNIGGMQRKQKSRSVDKYKKAIEEAIEKGTKFTEEEIHAFLDQKRGKDTSKSDEVIEFMRKMFSEKMPERFTVEELKNNTMINLRENTSELAMSDVERAGRIIRGILEKDKEIA